MKQRKRNSRGGGGGRVAVLRKETEDKIFRSYKSRVYLDSAKETRAYVARGKGDKERHIRAKRVLQICRPWYERERVRE